MSRKPYNLAIHTIFLPRENLFFIKEWLAYHSMIGVDHFYLYDNTGSVGRDGSNEEINKYGVDFHSPTSGLDDAEVRLVLEQILDEFRGRVTLVDWQPRDEHGRVVYGPVESVRHCMEHFAADSAWLCAIDMDEFLFSPPGEAPAAILSELAAAGCSRVELEQKKFADRFERPDSYVVEVEDCIEGIDTSGWAPKDIVLTDHFDPAAPFTIHDIPVRTGRKCRLDPDRLRFNHYNVNEKLLDWMRGYYGTSTPFSLNAVDPGMRRYRREIYRACRTYGSPWWRNAIRELSRSRRRRRRETARS